MVARKKRAAKAVAAPAKSVGDALQAKINAMIAELPGRAMIVCAWTGIDYLTVTHGTSWPEALGLIEGARIRARIGYAQSFEPKKDPS